MLGIGPIFSTYHYSPNPSSPLLVPIPGQSPTSSPPPVVTALSCHFPGWGWTKRGEGQVRTPFRPAAVGVPLALLGWVSIGPLPGCFHRPPLPSTVPPSLPPAPRSSHPLPALSAPRPPHISPMVDVLARLTPFPLAKSRFFTQNVSDIRSSTEGRMRNFREIKNVTSLMESDQNNFLILTIFSRPRSIPSTRHPGYQRNSSLLCVVIESWAQSFIPNLSWL